MLTPTPHGCICTWASEMPYEMPLTTATRPDIGFTTLPECGEQKTGERSEGLLGAYVEYCSLEAFITRIAGSRNFVHVVDSRYPPDDDASPEKLMRS